jgi:hypothetical protein
MCEVAGSRWPRRESVLAVGRRGRLHLNDRPGTARHTEAAGNVQIKIFDFPFQSFFDSTQLAQALAVQPQNEPIVPLTKVSVPTAGFGLGLHPDSGCPIAVKFKSSAGVSDSQVMTLVPGQIVYPHGCAPFS